MNFEKILTNHINDEECSNDSIYLRNNYETVVDENMYKHTYLVI